MRHSHPKHQRGIALATALIFLVVITLLGLVAIRSSTTGLKLALNEQTQTDALVTAQSMMTAVLKKTSTLPAQPGDKLCYQFSVPWADLEETAPVLWNDLKQVSPEKDGVPCPVPVTKNEDGAYVTIQRLPPKASPPPAKSLTSLVRFGAATFALRGIYDGSKHGLGAADIEQGIKQIVPRSRRAY